LTHGVAIKDNEQAAMEYRSSIGTTDERKNHSRSPVHKSLNS